MTLNMGPQHPSTHGVLRVLLELDGETVMQRLSRHRLSAHRHREGVRGQELAAGGAAHRSRRLPGQHDQQPRATALAVEKLLGVPEKCREAGRWMRVMLAELTRINSHCVWLGTHALDIGAMTVFFYCFREREEILRIFEMFSGQRMMTSYIRLGGLALEPPRGWHKAVRKFIDAFPEKVDEYEELLDKNPIWLRPHQGRRLRSAGGHARLGRHRADDSRRRRALGHPQGRALLRLREIRFQCSDPHRERRLGAVPRAHGRDAAERARS